MVLRKSELRKKLAETCPAIGEIGLCHPGTGECNFCPAGKVQLDKITEFLKEKGMGVSSN